jgi:hypothetical protein
MADSRDCRPVCRFGQVSVTVPGEPIVRDGSISNQAEAEGHNFPRQEYHVLFPQPTAIIGIVEFLDVLCSQTDTDLAPPDAASQRVKGDRHDPARVPTEHTVMRFTRGWSCPVRQVDRHPGKDSEPNYAFPAQKRKSNPAAVRRAFGLDIPGRAVAQSLR